MKLRAIALCGLLALTGCTSAGPSTSGTGAVSTETIVDEYFKGSLVSLMDYVASEQGFFKNRGVNVELVGMTSGPEALSAALAGDLHVFNTARTLTDPITQQGECVQYLTAGARSLLTVIARPGLDLPNKGKAYPAPLKDLKGAKVGIVARGSASETRMNVMLKDAGLSARDVTYVAVGGVPTSVAALQAGTIDFLQAFPPIEAVLGEGKYQRVASYVGDASDNPLKDMIFGAQAATCDFVKEHPAAVTSYCRGIWDAYDFANDAKNNVAMGDLISTFLSVDKTIGAELWRQYKSAFKSPLLTESEWRAQNKFGTAQLAQYTPPFEESVNSDCVTSDPRK